MITKDDKQKIGTMIDVLEEIADTMDNSAERHIIWAALNNLSFLYLEDVEYRIL